MVTREIEYFNWHYKEAKEKKTDESFLDLANDYALGYGTKKNERKALKYFKKAIKKNNPEALCRFGHFYLFSERFRDYKKAISYLEKSAALNYTSALYSLGQIYLEGHFATKNEYLAFKYLKKADDLGFKYFEFYLNLAYCYYYGRGTPKDMKLAFINFKKAKDAGSKKAEEYLLDFYKANKKYNEIIDILKSNPIPKAQYIAFDMYYKGEGVEQNKELAFEYLKKAAESRYTDAENRLAYYLFLGLDIAKDVNKAVDLYTKAFNKGSVLAASNLALIYAQEKEGVKFDFEKCFKCASFAASKGDTISKRILGYLYIKEGKRHNLDEGIRWLKEATYEGDFNAFTSYALALACNKNGGAKELFDLFERFKSNYKAIDINGDTIFVSDMQKSHAFMFYKNGSKTYGKYKDGKITGYGTSLYSNGIYYGHYLDFYRHGKGTYYWNNKNKYNGDFIKDKRTGKGRFEWADHDVYEGDFVDGKMTGQGTYWWNNGTVYEGGFKDNKYNGYGKKWYKNGDYYEGEFLNSKLHGYGKYIYKNGDVLEGEWRDNERYNVTMKSYSTNYDDEPSSSYDDGYVSNDDFDYDSDAGYDDYMPSSSFYETLVDDYGNETEISTITGRDSDGNLRESDGPFSDTYHMVDEDDD